jgi:cyclophilin family peptidyl-prolyl cis-trans isomerase/HEAT repeat protein
MRRRNPNCFCLAVGWFILLTPCAFVMTNAFAQTPTRGRRAQAQIPHNVLLRIVRAEDERRWDANLMALLSNESADVRRRAALATGRIGDERAVPSLISLLEKDSDESVQAMAAFALGETESPAGADALVAELSLNERKPEQTRARAVEALGKIAAALPKSEEARAHPMREAILRTLEFEAGRRSMPDREVILLGLTAVLRARPENVGKVIARFLGYSDPRVRADAANTLARLRLNDGNDALRKIVTSDPDPIVRANAARVLGATEDKAGFDALLDRAIKDADLRVRVGAIRALGALKDPRAAAPLLARGERLFAIYRARRAKRLARPTEINEILEIANTLGRVLAGTKNEPAVDWLRKLGRAAPEVDIAFARIAPATYVEDTTVCCPKPPSTPLDVRYGGSSVAQGWSEIASNPNALTKGMAGLILRNAVCFPSVDGPQCTSRAKDIEVPDHLRAYVAFKPNDIADVLRKQLRDSDVIVRATAVELLGNLPPDETNTHALAEALPVALKDRELNDAALAILDALAKQKSAAANDAIKTVLDSTDHLIRRRAVALLKANGVGDFSDRIGTVQTRNTTADYERAIGRIGKQVRAVVTTSKGSFVIELLSEDAPLTVDNFVMLARKGFFNGQMIPRVVPNFVVQAGDPRGDTNGGPGYQIRCEINEVPYDRAAVGMALSGKDTGGSQWFVTHSPQPHLDGGYTVFGRVISGMEVVDGIVRGDIIKSVSVTEHAERASKPATVKRMSQSASKRM